MTAVAQQTRENEIEPGSVVLFFLLLWAFIAILALRAQLVDPVDSSAAVAASAASPTVLAAKSSSLRASFWRI